MNDESCRFLCIKQVCSQIEDRPADHFWVSQYLALELAVYFLGAICLWHAFQKGRVWLSTLLTGMVIGFIIELHIVSTDDPSGLHYVYETEGFLGIIGCAPTWLAVGWGCVMYASTWTAQRWPHRWYLRPVVAGLLAVNIDASLDPVAQNLKYWVWHYDGSYKFLYFDVPYDNFIAWFVIVAGFCLARDAAIAGAKRWLTGRFWRGWVPVAVPPVAGVLSFLLFLPMRAFAPQLYAMFEHSDEGQAITFTLIYVGSFVVFWTGLPVGRRDLPINRLMLFVPIYCHLLFFWLFVIYGKVWEQPILLVAIPTNLVVGFFGYAWPSLDQLFPRSKWRKATEERFELQRVEVEDLQELWRRASRNNADIDPADTLLQAGLLREEYERLKGLAGENGRGRSERLDLVLVLNRFRRRGVRSYGGEQRECWYVEPEDERELRAAVRLAQAIGFKFSFRGTGHAFDVQSLNEDLVISLTRMRSIHVSRMRHTVTVGPGSTWGEILEETLRLDMIPYVLVTSEKVCAAGSLASNSLSRFSVSCGRECRYVDSLVLLLPDGTIRECSESQDPELFRATIGGFGFLGAVIEITYRLVPLPASWRGVRVKTDFTLLKEREFERLPDIVNALESRKEAHRKSCEGQDEVQRLFAVSATVYLYKENRALIATSRYVDGATQLDSSVFHSPKSFWHRATQVAALFPFVRRLVYGAVLRHADGKTHVDEIQGYSFFEDGNVWLKAELRGIGIPVTVRQNSYFLRTADDLKRFLQTADDAFGDEVVPALIDVLYLQGEGGLTFGLSCNHDTDGYLVTVTFEGLGRSPNRAETDATRGLIRTCHDLGGRLHLVKNVPHDYRSLFSDQGDPYAAQLTALARLRDEHQAERLGNDFSRKIGLTSGSESQEM